MSCECDRCRPDVALYVIGALEAEERAAMRWHLPTCPACRAEYEELLPVRYWLDQTRQHLTTCRACRDDYQAFLRPGHSPTARKEERGPGRPRPAS
jgi:predicted anti-sigma-YlaC factor YlaD